MSGVRAIVLSDDPNDTISKTQQAALSAVANTEWPRYQTLQDQELRLLDPRSNPMLLSNPRLSYENAYTLLFEANQLFLGLKLDWQQVVDSAQTIGEIVTNVGPSQTQPIVQSTLIALLLTLLVIILIGIIVNSSITRPLHQLAMLTRRIASGDTSARAPLRGRDEIHMVASSMNSMLDTIVQLLAEAQSRGDRLQFQVEKLLHEVSGVGEGNLRVQADMTLPDLGLLATSFNFMVQALSSLIIRVKMVAQEVVRTTGETARVMSQFVESNRQQIAQINAASGDIERMASASQRVAQRTKDLSVVAEQARQTASAGAAAVQRTVQGMGRINDNVRETAQKVQLLEERSSAINDISTFMGTIAQRTQRLALDATIQASMAGASGTGFAAVADDIRRLAEQAKEQASRIMHIERTIRGDIAEVHSAMRETTSETQSGAQLAQQAGVALASIFAAVQRQENEIQTISQTAVDQVQVSAAVVQAMQRVSAATQRSSVTTQEVMRSMEYQGQLVTQLHTSVGAFRVRDERQGMFPALVGEIEGGNSMNEKNPPTSNSGTLSIGNASGRRGARPQQHKGVGNRPTWQQPPS